jgi:restriction system protein
MPMYEIEISHKGLHKHRVIRDRDPYVARAKAAAQQAAWDEAWHKHVATERKRQQREQVAKEKQARKELALELTKEAEQALQRIENTLRDRLAKPLVFSWDALKDTSQFSTPSPEKPAPPPRPGQLEIPREPKPSDAAYEPHMGLLDKLFPSRARRKQANAEEAYEDDHKAWQKEKRRITLENRDREMNHAASLKKW